MKRIKLKDRLLPQYCTGEEIMNMVTHIVGGGFGIIALLLCIYRAFVTDSVSVLIGGLVYGLSMIGLYSMSSIYHGLNAGTGKKVMQVMDHCAIYFLIAGTYTPILLVAFLPVYPVLGWCLLGLEWALCILAATLTAIDLKKYRVFSMICYILMGWAIIFVYPIAWTLIGKAGFLWLLLGGILYTIGAVLYGVGSKTPWFHSIFHIFVVLGSIFQFISIYFYIL